MYLCYIDESGVPEINNHTSTHFVLIGLTICAPDWKVQDQAVEAIKTRYGMLSAEIHTAWMAKRFIEQERVPNFEALEHNERRRLVRIERQRELTRVGSVRGLNSAAKLRRDYRKSDAYIHLTLAERKAFLRDIAALIGSWDNVVLFGDAIDKRSFTEAPQWPPREEAFTQIISRFQFFLNNCETTQVGLLVHDNEETSALRLTQMMREFHERGTYWADIHNIIETPFFVDSALNRGVQLADVCAYATRRFFENGETDLFELIYPRFRRLDNGRLVGLRHYVGRNRCACRVCADHNLTARAAVARPRTR